MSVRDQPIHGVPALGHLLGESATVDPSRGVFLDQTWRMHPHLRAFTTEQYLRRATPPPTTAPPADGGGPRAAGRSRPALRSRGACRQHERLGRGGPTGVTGLIRELLDAGAACVDREGVRKPLTLQDVLVVALYNAHVAVLRSTLPAGARVGTVDKFQRQEARRS